MKYDAYILHVQMLYIYNIYIYICIYDIHKIYLIYKNGEIQ